MDPSSLDSIYAKKRHPGAVAFVLILLVAAGLGGYQWWTHQKAAADETAAPADEATAETTVAEVAPTPVVAAQEAVAAAPAAPAATPEAEAATRAALAKAKELRNTGDVLQAREVLLAALPAVPEALRAEFEAQLGKLSRELFISLRPGPGKVEYVVKDGDSLAAIASNFVCPKEYIANVNHITVPSLIRPGQRLSVLDHPVWTVTVSKSRNTLLLELNGEFFARYVVGTGREAKTPAGTYKMVDKILHPEWWTDAGKVIPYGDKENVLGTHWLALEATGETPRVKGYGIHGTWDNDSLGKQSSAGCVRMRNEEVEELYSVLPRGTAVRIVE